MGGMPGPGMGGMGGGGNQNYRSDLCVACKWSSQNYKQFAVKWELLAQALHPPSGRRHFVKTTRRMAGTS